MTQKKQTAVQWLELRLEKFLELYPSKWDMFDNAIKQAKELEKQQIIDAWAHGVFAKNSDTAEQYYSETYGGNNGQQ